MAEDNDSSCDKFDSDAKPENIFTLKKWNAVAMWSWDVECDTCAICRVQVMGEYIAIIHSFLGAFQVRLPGKKSR